MRNLAIIPARSGSKGLKDKNIRNLLGKPMLAYSIEAARESGCFSCIHVSTDSERYADIGKEYGADIPFLRSEEMSSDTAGSWDMVREVLAKYQQLGQEFDTVTLLQPTSPLRKAEDIVGGYRLFETKQADAVVSVCEAEHSPLWCNTLPEDYSMDSFLKHDSDNPRQKLSTYYRLNGALYIVKTQVLLENRDLYEKNCYAYLMPQERSVDIDTELDFCIAEAVKKYFG